MTPREASEAVTNFLDALDVLSRAARESIPAIASVIASSSTSTTASDDKDLWTIEVVLERFPVSKRMLLRARRKGLVRGEAPAGSNRILFEPKSVEEWVRSRASRSSSLRVVR